MPSVLVVDDDQQIRALVRQILESKGYHVEEAGNGIEALALINRYQPTLMILDIYLPGMDGLEVITQLKLRTQPVKVLAISGNAIDGFDTCKTAMALGAHDALAKPFSADIFLQRVEALLAQP
jgi:DNA-binding response OmpR family regulator